MYCGDNLIHESYATHLPELLEAFHLTFVYFLQFYMFLLLRLWALEQSSKGAVLMKLS